MQLGNIAGEKAPKQDVDYLPAKLAPRDLLLMPLPQNEKKGLLVLSFLSTAKIRDFEDVSSDKQGKNELFHLTWILFKLMGF